MKAVDFIAQFRVWSHEGQRRFASKSEVRRWLTAGSVWVNAEQLGSDEVIDFPLISVVLFPKGQRITLL